MRAASRDELRLRVTDVDDDYGIDDGLVERLHALLSDALRRTRPDPFESPVTVAEIYQDLVPYRGVRAALGFQMNADYEHTLLRLLAGESGLTRLEPDEARQELSAELRTPNPNVGLFRKFAACDVWIEPSHLPVPVTVVAVPPPPPPAMTQPEMAPPPIVEAPPPHLPPEPEPIVVLDDSVLPEEPESLPEAMWESETVVVLEPASGDVEWEVGETELLLEEAVEETGTSPDTSGQTPQPAGEPTNQPEPALMFESKSTQATLTHAEASGNCAFCRTTLPAGRRVRFCPQCGADQSMHPCVSCGEPLEAGWKFCIACGSQQT